MKNLAPFNKQLHELFDVKLDDHLLFEEGGGGHQNVNICKPGEAHCAQIWKKTVFPFKTLLKYRFLKSA